MDGNYGVVVASARHHLERTSGSGFSSERGAWSRTTGDKAAGRAEARIPQRGFGSGLGWDNSARGAAAGSVKAVAMATVAGVVVVSFKRGVVGLRSHFDLERVRACVRAVFLCFFNRADLRCARRAERRDAMARRGWGGGPARGTRLPAW